MNEAYDMLAVTQPKSDQINADDLIGGPIDITIREVRISRGQEQPISVYFEGSDKAFRPCKTMARAMVEMWGPDASKYLGKSLRLYRDPKVRFGKDEVGGIRISHASHIEEPKKLMLTATRGQRRPHLIQPLVAEVRQMPNAAAEWTDKFIAKVAQAPDADALNSFVAGQIARLDKLPDDLRAKADAAVSDMLAKFHPTEGRADADMGEGFTDDEGGF